MGDFVLCPAPGHSLAVVFGWDNVAWVWGGGQRVVPYMFSFAGALELNRWEESPTLDNL